MIARSRQPTAVDLFSGAGGLSLGFHTVGCRLLSAYDADPQARDSYARNFSVLQADSPPDVLDPEGEFDPGLELGISRSRLEARGIPDILLAAPPCQGFSPVGRGKLDSLSEAGFARDPSNKLCWRVIELIDVWRPSAVILENVPGMRNVGGRSFAEEAARLLTRDYAVGYGILNAVEFGVPQYRSRLFIIAIRKDLGVVPELPTATHAGAVPTGYESFLADTPLPFEEPLGFQLTLKPNSSAYPFTTVSAALDDLPVLTSHVDGTGGWPDGDVALPYREEPTSRFVEIMRNWPGLCPSDAVTLHRFRKNKRDFETFELMRHDDRYADGRRIALERFDQVLDACSAPPEPGSVAYKEKRNEYVPPYPVDKFKDKWRKLTPWSHLIRFLRASPRTVTPTFTTTASRLARSRSERRPDCSHSQTATPSRVTWGSASARSATPCRQSSRGPSPTSYGASSDFRQDRSLRSSKVLKNAGHAAMT